jgi:hypothetical protein
MADFKISGRMSVERLQKQFKDNFGSSLRVYKGAVFADPKATLASIRTSDDKGGDFTVRGNMHVGTFEDEMLKRFGIRVQVSSADDSKLLPNDMTLAVSGKALSKAGKPNRSAGNESGSGETGDFSENGDEENFHDKPNLKNTEMYKLRKLESYTVTRTTQTATLDPEKFRGISIPYEGNSEEEFLNYIDQLDFLEIEEELDSETKDELNKFHDYQEWEEIHNTAWDGANLWLELGEESDGRFEMSHTTEY